MVKQHFDKSFLLVFLDTIKQRIDIIIPQRTTYISSLIGRRDKYYLKVFYIGRVVNTNMVENFYYDFHVRRPVSSLKYRKELRLDVVSRFDFLKASLDREVELSFEDYKLFNSWDDETKLFIDSEYVRRNEEEFTKEFEERYGKKV